MDISQAVNIEKNSVYAIIPARSGSKGIKHKNIRLLNKYPLISYTIAAAKLSSTIERIFVSTDSAEYAEIAIKYGAEIPILRPENISQDNSRDIEFMIHIIDWLCENEGVLPEYFVHLRPTNPLRNPDIIDQAVIAMKRDIEASSLRSAKASNTAPYKWFLRNEAGYFKPLISGLSLDDANDPRQEFPVVFIPDGYVDVLRTEYIINNNKLHGDKMIAFESPDGIDIDLEEDMQEIEKMTNISKSLLYKYLDENFKE